MWSIDFQKCFQCNSVKHDSFFQKINGPGKPGYMQKAEPWFHIPHHIKINTKWVIDLYTNFKTIILSNGEHFCILAYKWHQKLKS